MASHQLGMTYLSQENLLDSGCFDLSMAMTVAEQAMLAMENHRIMFPEKIVQIFDQVTQDRINCLPATLLDKKVCGTKWVSVFPRNPKLHDAQNLSAVFILSEIEKGFPIAIMEGTLASNMRVAAMGGIAAKHLARQNCKTIGFIGAGEQAKMHLLAMKIVRPSLEQCRVSAKSCAEEQEFIEQLAPLLPDINFVGTNTVAKDAIEDADIIVTATSAQAPLLKAQWVKEGAFYSHIGGWEDEYAVAQLCDKIVCDDWDTVTHRTQTLSRMYKEGLLSHSQIHADLHELVSGQKCGRENESERIYFNAVGLSYVDIALAEAMYQRATQAHIGTALSLQESTVFEHHDIKSKLRL